MKPEHNLDELQPHLRVAPEIMKARVPLLLKKTAMELAGEFYGENRRSAAFRAFFPHEMKFVNAHWPEFVKIAREALLLVLHQSKSDHIRNEIYDAITNNFEERTKNSVKGIPNGKNGQ